MCSMVRRPRPVSLIWALMLVWRQWFCQSCRDRARRKEILPSWVTMLWRGRSFVSQAKVFAARWLRRRSLMSQAVRAVV